MNFELQSTVTSNKVRGLLQNCKNFSYCRNDGTFTKEIPYFIGIVVLGGNELLV